MKKQYLLILFLLCLMLTQTSSIMAQSITITPADQTSFNTYGSGMNVDITFSAYGLCSTLFQGQFRNFEIYYYVDGVQIDVYHSPDNYPVNTCGLSHVYSTARYLSIGTHYFRAVAKSYTTQPPGLDLWLSVSQVEQENRIYINQIPQPVFYDVTIASTDPEPTSGNNYIIDGVNSTNGGTFQWEQGTSHTLVAASSINACGYTLNFVRWNDGVTSQSRTITVTGNATYYAIYRDKYGNNPCISLE